MRKKIVVYVKDEGSNFHTMIVALKLVINYVVLGLVESFLGTYFGHAFSKACQYATNEKVYKGFKYVSIKTIEGDLWTMLTLFKNLTNFTTMEFEELACQAMLTIASHAKSTSESFVKMNGLILGVRLNNRAIFLVNWG